MTEYISLSHEQKTFGKKDLLYAQMELLNTVKHYQNYIKLKKLESTAKKSLRLRITEAREEISKLDSLLPKTKREKFASPKITISKEQKKRSTLQDEIDDIKRKISELQ